MNQTLTQRDGHLVHHWYMACLSHEVRTTPLARVIYDRALVLFRNAEGRVGCLPDHCLHRAARLSDGTVRGECLVCPYHGWHYTTQGDVQRVPSEDPSCTLKRPRHQALPVCEQDGAIWVWLGTTPPPAGSLPWRFPFASDPSWEHYFMITDFPNEVTNLVENFMDVPHTVFVHRGWFRDEKAQRKAVPATVETAEGKVVVTYHHEQDEFSLGARLLINPKRQPMKHTDTFIFPNLTRVDYWFGDHGFIINSQCTPVSALKTRVYTYIAYKIAHLRKILKPAFRFYTRQVITQDVAIMHSQSQVLAQHLAAQTQPRFHSTPVDDVHLAIERLRRLGTNGDPSLHTIKDQRELRFWI